MGHNGDTQLTTHDFQKVLEHLGRGANARTVYGEPTIVGEHAVIPVARVHYMGGGGLGSGTGTTHHEGTDEITDADAPDSSGEGMGLGFTVSARPIGAIDITADSLHWSPAMDWARLANIAATVTGAMAVMWTAKRLFRST